MRKSKALATLILLFVARTALAGNPARLVVFPLDALSREGNLGWLGEGIAMSLGDQIESRSLKVIGHNQRIRFVENLDLPPGGRLSRGSMIRVAQQAAADFLVMGSFSGTERNLKIAVRVLDLKTLKLSGEMTANGPVSALPQMENELAWLILTNADLGEKTCTRAEFQQRMRKVPNAAYSYFIQSYGSPSKSGQIQLLKRAVESCRNFPKAQFVLGQLYFSKRDCESAMAHLSLGRSEGSDGPAGDFMLGTCYLAKGQLEQAIELLSSIPTGAHSYEDFNNVGIAYLRKGDNDSALRALSEARALARADSTIAFNLAVAQMMVQGNDSVARNTVEDALKVHPKNGMLQFLLSFILQRQGESEKASLAADKAKSLGINVEALQPEDPKAWTRIIYGRVN